MKYKLFLLTIFLLMLNFSFSQDYNFSCETDLNNTTFYEKGTTTFNDSLGIELIEENICKKNLYEYKGDFPKVLIVKNCDTNFLSKIDLNEIDYSKVIIESEYICENGCKNGACVDRNKQNFEDLYWNPYPQISSIINGVAIYYDPRIDSKYTGSVPYTDEKSATKWCSMKDPQFIKGEGKSYQITNQINPVMQWNGEDWEVFPENNLVYTYVYYCYTKDYLTQEKQEIIPENINVDCPNNLLFGNDCTINKDGQDYKLFWQYKGDLPENANGINNPNSDYYFNPRIYINGIDNVPAHNETTATKWCKLLTHKNYVLGKSVTNWPNPIGERKNWNGQNWEIIENGDYPRYYHCLTTPNQQNINTQNNNQTKTNQQNNQNPENQETIINCFGCLKNEICYPAGYRLNGTYCDVTTGNLINQKTDGLACENSFECTTNVCAGNKCITQGFIETLIEFFSNLGKGFLTNWN